MTAKIRRIFRICNFSAIFLNDHKNEAFGKAVDISLDSFSQDWNMQFMRADDTSRYIEIFQEMEQVMRKIAKEKVASVKEK